MRFPVGQLSERRELLSEKVQCCEDLQVVLDGLLIIFAEIVCTSFVTWIFSFAIISAVVAAAAFSLTPFVEKAIHSIAFAASVAKMVSQIVRGSA